MSGENAIINLVCGITTGENGHMEKKFSSMPSFFAALTYTPRGYMIRAEDSKLKRYVYVELPV